MRYALAVICLAFCGVCSAQNVTVTAPAGSKVDVAVKPQTPSILSRIRFRSPVTIAPAVPVMPAAPMFQLAPVVPAVMPAAVPAPPVRVKVEVRS